MKIITKLSSLVASLVLVSATFSPVLVLAHNGVDHSGGNNSHRPNQQDNDDSVEETENEVEHDTEVETHSNSKKLEDKSDKKNAKLLTDNKLKSCINREKSINNILSRIADRGQKQLDLFTSISEKTQKFATDKKLTVANYDTLLADVNSKKEAAQALVTEVEEKSVSFKCDGTDPKGAAANFKSVMKTEIEALKAYKTSVKNLIVGVKSSPKLQDDSDNDNDNETETNSGDQQ